MDMMRDGEQVSEVEEHGRLQKAGRLAWQYFLDTGECLFCAWDDNGCVHDEHCPFHGVEAPGS